jgi:hypothetical protein
MKWVGRIALYFATALLFANLWNIYRINRAIEAGALKHSTVCLFENDLRFKDPDKAPDKFVNLILTREIQNFQGQRLRSTWHHFNGAAIYFGLKISWTADQRREFYRRLSPENCS